MMENLLQTVFPDFCPELRAELLLCGSFIELNTSEKINTTQLDDSYAIVLKGNIKALENIRNHYFLLFRALSGETLNLPLVEGKQREFKFIAESESLLLLVSFEASKSWICKYPAWRMFQERAHQKVLDKLLDTIWNSGDCLENRILNHLNDLATTNKTVELRITHSELAEEIGSVREVVSRSLKKLEQLEKVKLHRGKIALNTLNITD